MTTRIACLLAAILSATAWAAPPEPDGKPPYDTVKAICKGDGFKHWDNVKIDGEEYFVSPTLEYPGGTELNHFTLAMSYEGKGPAVVGLVHHFRNDRAHALKTRAFHNTASLSESGDKRKISIRYPGRRFFWVYIKADKNIKPIAVGFQAWTGRRTVYGHVGYVFNYKGGMLPYRLMYPKDYDPRKKYPLVVSGHGSGGTGSDNLDSMEMVTAARFLFTRHWDKEEFACFSLVPQIPSMNPQQTNVPDDYYPKGTKGAPDRKYHPDWPAVNEQGWHVQATLALIESLIQNPRISIDPDRVYYAGFSYGGKAIWEFFKAGRETFAAGISVAGWPIGRAYSKPEGEMLERLKKEASRYQHIPVFITAGEEDRMRLGSKAVHDVLQELGGNSKFMIIEGVGHVPSSVKTWNNAEVMEWLFDQRRDKNPKPGEDPYPKGDYAR